MNYRSEIDGLRAIAVISVILYHAQLIKLFGQGDLFEGGFIGVDIFFVISGYLITRIILTEYEQTNHFKFLKFYDRRIRRILPMFLVLIAFCTTYAYESLLPVALVDFAMSSLAAIGFISNFFFYFSTTEYGAESALLKPLLHTWSLGVEEQFYIIFPFIILLIWKVARPSMLTLLLGIFLISIQFAEMMSVRNPQLNFFLPFSRFWELLAGSSLAYIELKYGKVKNPLLSQTAPIIGLFFIAYSILFFDAKTLHPGFQTLLPVIGVALIIAFCSNEDFIGRLLSLKPLVGIGLISYSLYLWHFSIFAFGRLGTPDPSIYDKLEWILITFILSIITFFVIEKPFRNRTLINGKLFYSILSITLIGLIYTNYSFIASDGEKHRLASVFTKQDIDEPMSMKLRGKDMRHCHQRTLKTSSKFCSIENDISKTYVYSFGDSHTSALSTNLISLLGQNFNYLEANFNSCPFALGIDLYDSNWKKDKDCNSSFQDLRNSNIEKKNSIILISGRLPLYLESVYFDNNEGGIEGGEGPKFKSVDGLSLRQSIVNTIRKLINDGHQVILIYPIPEVGVNVPNYVFNYARYKKVSDLSSIKPLTTSYDVYIKRSKSSFELFDSISSPNIHRVYPHTLFCDNEIKNRCITHNNEDVFYSDDDHPSDKGAAMIAKLVMNKILAAEENIRSK